MNWGLRTCRVVIAIVALIGFAAALAPACLLALAWLALYVAWQGCAGRLRRRSDKPWDEEGGSPELPWPPRESPRERQLREEYARRRVPMPPWAAASRREFAEAKRKAVAHG